MRRRIGDIESDVIFTGGVLVGGYFLVKKLLPDLLPNLGISDGDRATLDAQQNTPAGANVFDTNYPSAQSFFQDNLIDEYAAYNADDDTAFFAGVWRAFQDGNLATTDPVYPLMVIYHGLYNALVGHLISGNQDDINYYLNQITNKYQIGILQNMFQDINGLDLWQLLRRGWGTCLYGLNGTDLAAQVKRLNALPE